MATVVGSFGSRGKGVPWPPSSFILPSTSSSSPPAAVFVGQERLVLGEGEKLFSLLLLPTLALSPSGKRGLTINSDYFKTQNASFLSLSLFAWGGGSSEFFPLNGGGGEGKAPFEIAFPSLR